MPNQTQLYSQEWQLAHSDSYDVVSLHPVIISTAHEYTDLKYRKIPPAWVFLKCSVAKFCQMTKHISFSRL
jgi:hypothetical protein